MIENFSEDKGSNIILNTEILPNELIILPLAYRPVFPGIMFPIIINGVNLVNVIKIVAEREKKYLGGVLIKNFKEEQDILVSDLYEVGTVLKIHKFAFISDDSVQLLIQGLQRFRKVSEVSNNPLTWRVEYLYDREDENSDEFKAYTLSLISYLKELLKLNPLFQEQIKMLMSYFSTEKPGKVIDLIASMTTADPEKLQELLETLDLLERAKKLLNILKEEIEVLKLQEKIRKNIDNKISEQQKKFFLMEELKQIKKELGLEKDEKSTEIEKYEKKVKGLKLTPEAKKVFYEEFEKFKLLEPASAEYHVVRTYLDWITDLPWGKYSKERLDIKKAKKILDKNHYGLDDIKDRILEFISVGKKKGTISGSILCLVGPPGVGKTSIGKSIAEAVNRKFFRFSVGGMRDEAEIKGHRRTYIGAMPGKIIQSLKRTKTSNPVIMLDEIDKMGISFQGDPAAALLEVLDPEQNKDFLDHYLDIRYDLSKILFITTANTLDSIPPALLDRMEVLKLSGYLLQEKIEIAKKFLLPKLLEECGFKSNEIRIEEDALKYLIEGYSREAGVRSLENNIKKIIRKIAKKQAEGEKNITKIKKDDIEKYLGKPLYQEDEIFNTKNLPGVVTGLAWTNYGGAVLFIEAVKIKSKTPGLKQTGQLGNVMQESAEIAYSYIRSKVKDYGIPEDFFAKYLIHLHVPEGATPKDGPSAGITMTLALYSLATNKPVRSNIAMTGEMTLTGKVLPIGGVKEKIIAGKRLGIKEFILPIKNKKDFEELPDYIKENLTIYYAEYFDDVLKAVYNNE